MSQKIIQLKTSVPNIEEAEKLAELFVVNKLAACVQYFPIRSVYSWKGNIERSEEYVLIIKTINTRKKQIVETLQKVHSYELPELTILENDFVTEGYSFWVEQVTSEEDLEKDNK
ncbi:MAG: divalent-cation tolerance protein CutA [Candidatus Heimdallarchaeota archaeon]|nr:divalent-cation tolerance protein CutA [Candidatus Heimdallarchaeota archaeon]